LNAFKCEDISTGTSIPDCESYEEMMIYRTISENRVGGEIKTNNILE